MTCDDQRADDHTTLTTEVPAPVQLVLSLVPAGHHATLTTGGLAGIWLHKHCMSIVTCHVRCHSDQCFLVPHTPSRYLCGAARPGRMKPSRLSARPWSARRLSQGAKATTRRAKPFASQGTCHTMTIVRIQGSSSAAQRRNRSGRQVQTHVWAADGGEMGNRCLIRNQCEFLQNYGD